ncbi:MAG: hypothetical protein RIS76_4326 [Verrucomicrobiota bacterium]
MFSACLRSHAHGVLPQPHRHVPGSHAALVLAGLLGLITAFIDGRAADWPGWRGPIRNGHSALGTPTLEHLPAEPRRVWRLKIGDGLASPVVAGSRVYYLDAQDTRETVHAIDRDTAKEAWSVTLDDGFKNGQTAPGPRCTPLVDGDRMYVQSCRGELQCLGTGDGTVRWRVNFLRDFQSGAPAESGVHKGAQRHGFTASPWIEGDQLIALVGDTHAAGVVSFDKRDGKVRWKSQKDRAANAAPIVASFPGSPIRQVVAFTVEGLIGLNLDDGGLLWRVPITTTYGRHVMTPVVVGGIAMVASKEECLIGVAPALDSTTGRWEAPTAWQTKEILVNFSSPVAVGDYLYGLGSERNLFCVDTRTGAVKWSQGGFATQSAEKSHLALVAVGKNLLALTETGELVLVAADPAGFRELGRTQACGSNWCNPAYADGRLYLRDSKELICLQLVP